jgi:hypothetical protein
VPHLQVRTRTAASPGDIANPLAILRTNRIDIRGISTSAPDDDEGEIGLLLDDKDVDDAIAALSDFQARAVDDAGGAHLDYVEDVPGGLLAAIERARAHHPDLKVKDIAISVDKHVLSVDQDGNLLRDGNSGELAPDPRAPHVHAHLVQIYFEGQR